MKKEKKSGLIKYKGRSVARCSKLCVIIVFRNEKNILINYFYSLPDFPFPIFYRNGK